jgi:hypothetical protein
MRRLHNGGIVLDWLDVLCISFEVGAIVAYVYRKYRQSKTLDPLISEIKENSLILEEIRPIQKISTKSFSKKLPLLRGGDLIANGGEMGTSISIGITNRKFTALIKALVETKRSQKLMKLLQIFLAIVNASMTSKLGLRVAVGGSLDFTHIILFAVSGSVSGFLVGQILNPTVTLFLPIAIMFGRGIEDVPDPQEKCRLICKIAENYHNKEHLVEMQELNSLIADTSEKLQLPLDKVPLVSVECVKDKVSILQRYKLRQIVESTKVKNRVQHYDKFIKKFPECEVDLEEIAQEVGEKMIK